MCGCIRVHLVYGNIFSGNNYFVFTLLDNAFIFVALVTNTSYADCNKCP